MRLIDADALVDALMMHTWYDEDERIIDDDEPKREYIKGWLPDISTVSGWISVKDRLPDTYKAVITYDKNSGVKENWLLRASPCVNWSQGFHVTHWMPMPEPPKEDNDAEQ